MWTFHFIRFITTLRYTITSPNLHDALAVGTQELVIRACTSWHWTCSKSNQGSKNQLKNKQIFGDMEGPYYFNKVSGGNFYTGS
jgi:hypothetical protein